MNAERTAKARPLWLTGEEAGHLLALAVASQANFGEAEERILQKLGEVVRAFLRDEAAEQQGQQAHLPQLQPAHQPSSPIAARRRMHRSIPRTLIATRAW